MISAKTKMVLEICIGTFKLSMNI